MPGLFKHPYARYQREAIDVSMRKNPFIQDMQYPGAFDFSSIYPLRFVQCAGLRVVARRFQAFLAPSAFTVSASSYYFYSIVRLLVLRQFWCVNAE